MTFLLALLAGFAGAAVGAGAGAVVLAILGTASGNSGGDIGSAFFMVAVFMPIGILGGLAAGVVPTLRSRGVRSRGPVAGYLGAVTATIAVITGAVLGAYIYSIDIIMNPNGPTPLIAFEVRLPAGAPLPIRNGVELRTTKNHMPGSWNPQSVRKEGDRTVFAGEVEMAYKVSGRLLAITLADKTEVTFDLNLGRAPAHSKTFGKWQRAAYIAAPGKGSVMASAQDGYDIRYRAAWVGKD